jgi:lipoprotein signal peptidase
MTSLVFGLRAAAVASLAFGFDELLKTVARAQLTPCLHPPLSACDRIGIAGPIGLLRTSNAGSAFGLRQGWWVWVLLALVGVALIPLYARLLGGGGWLASIGVGLQLGGACANVLDRLLLGGATDVVYAGRGPIWNLADVALVVGTALATIALLRSRLHVAEPINVTPVRRTWTPNL